MKYFVVAMLSLVSSVAMADGFRCSGDGYRVKLYNEVNPKNGTKNPAVFVVYEKGVGTVATLFRDEISAEYGKEVVTYDGQTNGKLDGRFVYVKLEIEKQAQEQGPLAGARLAQLTVNADGESRIAELACTRYLKGDRR